VAKILFVHNSRTQFVRLDLDELSKRHLVTEYYVRSRLINPLSVWRQVQAHDLVFGWFASWHTFLPICFAKLIRKPSLLIIGGYDLANMPVIGYGHQRGGAKKWIGRWTMHGATCLVTNSSYSRDEALQNAAIPKLRMHVVYHGVPDVVGALPNGPRAQMVLTVGNVDRSNLTRKGHEPFVRAAALLPDVEFVLAGKWKDDAIEHLRAIATPNVTFTGFISDGALWDYYRRSAVYVQASLHEGFGMSVAEAMLAGCVPVVTRAGALPEVVGKEGLFINKADPAKIAQAVRDAFASSGHARALVRQRILDHFPMGARGEELERLIAPLLQRSN
jgi:glycosyltransferase involved in cell wall biosynthesis